MAAPPGFDGEPTMKRIALFLITNIAVLAVITIILRVFGLDRAMTAQTGMSYGSLLAFSAVVGFAGAIVSLLMSKSMAKWSMGLTIIEQPRNDSEAWLLETVRKLATTAKVGMPEVGVYEGAPNAFATGAFRNSALVAVSTGLLAIDEQGGSRGGARPRNGPRRQRRHGDACADPGRRQHVRGVPVACRGIDRRSRGVSHRARHGTRATSSR